MNTQKKVIYAKDVDHADVLVADYQCSMISTDRLLRMEDFGIEVENLPKSSRKLLKQHVLPADFTKPYINLLNRAKAEFQRWGSKTVMGHVFSHDRGPYLIEKLDEIKADWKKQVQKDELRFSEMAEKHIRSIEADPDVQCFEHKDSLIKAVRKAQPNWETVSATLFFDYTVMVVGQAGDFDPAIYQKIKDSVVAIKEGAVGSLIREVCATARSALETALKAETRVHSRTVESVWGIVEKLDDLAFLDKRVRVVEQQLRAVMSRLTRSQALYDHEYDTFINIMMALSNQHIVVRKLELGEPLIQVVETADIFADEQASSMAAEAPTPVHSVEQIEEPIAAVAVVDTEDEEVASVEVDELEFETAKDLSEVVTSVGSFDDSSDHHSDDVEIGILM